MPLIKTLEKGGVTHVLESGAPVDKPHIVSSTCICRPITKCKKCRVWLPCNCCQVGAVVPIEIIHRKIRKDGHQHG